MTKNIEWLKEEITEVLLTSKKDGTNYFYYRDLKEKIYNAINQLDEPEVLSQEWIDEHAVRKIDGKENPLIVYVDDLQNLLVPKQEEITHKQVEKYLLDKNIRVIDIDIYEKMQSDLAELENKIIIEKPVIPQFVANYIKWFKNDFEHNFAADIDFIISLIQVSHKFSRREKIKNWISKSGNAQKLLDAYRWGYEVEEEQKYRVLDGNTTLLGRINGLMLTTVEILEYYPEYAPTFDLTEQEIKDYDDRFWPFAVKVEELEE